MRRFVVWGDNALARRLVGELINSYGAQVTAVVPSVTQHLAPEIAELCAPDPWSMVVQERRLTAATFLRPELADAEAIAFVDADDVANVDAALIAREALPGVRVVLRMFNTVLGAGVASRVRNCAVLSASEIAAPAFVAAALGDNTAPAFAASMVGSEAVDTIPVGRRVLLVAEVRVGARSVLEGRPFHEVGAAGELRLVAVKTGRPGLGQGGRTFWWPERSRGRTLDRSHTMIVVATRAGLVSLLEHAAARP